MHVLRLRQVVMAELWGGAPTKAALSVTQRAALAEFGRIERPLLKSLRAVSYIPEQCLYDI